MMRLTQAARYVSMIGGIVLSASFCSLYPWKGGEQKVTLLRKPLSGWILLVWMPYQKGNILCSLFGRGRYGASSLACSHVTM